MSELEELEDSSFTFKSRDGTRRSETWMRDRYLILMRIFYLCSNGSGLVEEALKSAVLLAEFLEKVEVIPPKGKKLPNTNQRLINLFVRKGMLEEAAAAADLEGRKLSNDELYIIHKILREKRSLQRAAENIAAFYVEEGWIVDAAVAALIAGRDLKPDEIERIQQMAILNNYSTVRGSS